MVNGWADEANKQREHTLTFLGLLRFLTAAPDPSPPTSALRLDARDPDPSVESVPSSPSCGWSTEEACGTSQCKVSYGQHHLAESTSATHPRSNSTGALRRRFLMLAPHALLVRLVQPSHRSKTSGQLEPLLSVLVVASKPAVRCMRAVSSRRSFGALENAHRSSMPPRSTSAS